VSFYLGWEYNQFQSVYSFITRSQWISSSKFLFFNLLLIRLVEEGEPLNNPVIIEPEGHRGIRFLDFLKTVNWTDRLRAEVQNDFINGEQISSCHQLGDDQDNAVNMSMREHFHPVNQPAPEFITYPQIDKVYQEPMESCSKP
jgi:hypothetical protein